MVKRPWQIEEACIISQKKEGVSPLINYEGGFQKKSQWTVDTSISCGKVAYVFIRVICKQRLPAAAPEAFYFLCHPSHTRHSSPLNINSLSSTSVGIFEYFL